MSNQPHPKPTHHMHEDLHQILLDMASCITEQESIILDEREAMKVFNAEALTLLVEQRARCQSILHELESRCKRMMRLSSGNHNTLEHLIDTCTGHDTEILQGMRVELMRRMQALEKDHVENHLRLRAAWNVTTSILQHIGAIQVPQTYQNIAQQVAR